VFFEILKEVIEVLTTLSRPYYENGMAPKQAVAFGAQEYKKRLTPAAMRSETALLRLQIVNTIAKEVTL